MSIGASSTTGIGAVLARGAENEATSDEEEAEAEADTEEEPLSYAELVQRSGITNIIFRYSTGTFHALDANGEEVVSGKTVKDIISAL